MLPSCRLVRRLSLPFLIYVVYFAVRLADVQPPADCGLGDFITALFLIGGGAIAYFTFLLAEVGIAGPTSARQRLFWGLASMVLVYLAFDEIFMVHEALGGLFQVNDALFLLLSGAVLACILAMNLRNYTGVAWLFLAGFVLMAGVATVSDYLYEEGLVVVFGRSIDYEQVAESIGAFCLAGALAAQGLAVIRGRGPVPARAPGRAGARSAAWSEPLPIKRVPRPPYAHPVRGGVGARRWHPIGRV